MKRSIIRTFTAILLFSFVVSSIWAVSSTKQTITTTFTAPQTCFVGFSRRKVVDNVKLRPDEHFMTASVNTEGDVIPQAVQFTFYPTDPIVSAKPSQKGVYYSDVFYAYCQVASRNMISVTLTASEYLFPEPNTNSLDGNLAYQFVSFTDVPALKEGLLDNTYADWGSSKSLVFKDEVVPTNVNEIRVLMCQPIFLRVDGADLNTVLTKYPNTQYFKLDFMIEVRVL